MHIIAGLGNPGGEYENTRHNVGFMLIDAILRESGSTSVAQIKFNSLITRLHWAEHSLIVMKPQSYVNLSGGPVQEALAFFKVKPAHLIVAFDDLDQAPGAVRARFGGGHGGHNGVRDILSKLGTDEFHRIKVGIGKPEHKTATAKWVLSRFSRDEMTELEQQSFKVALQRIQELLKRS